MFSASIDVTKCLPDLCMLYEGINGLLNKEDES